MIILSIILFLFLFLFVANRHAIRPSWNALFKKKVATKKVVDTRILANIKNKTGIILPYFLLFEDPFTLGMMAGIPGKPHMFLSKRAYTGDCSQKDEQEWVLMHETGHYVLGHSLKEGAYQLTALAVGIIILTLLHNFLIQLVTAGFLAIILGLLTIQIGKYHEYEAEQYALRKVTNPQGMVESGKRGIAGWKREGLPERSLFHRMFDRWEVTMYYQRIAMAKNEIEKRKRQ